MPLVAENCFLLLRVTARERDAVTQEGEREGGRERGREGEKERERERKGDSERDMSLGLVIESEF